VREHKNIRPYAAILKAKRADQIYARKYYERAIAEDGTSAKAIESILTDIEVDREALKYSEWLTVRMAARAKLKALSNY